MLINFQDSGRIAFNTMAISKFFTSYFIILFVKIYILIYQRIQSKIKSEVKIIKKNKEEFKLEIIYIKDETINKEEVLRKLLDIIAFNTLKKMGIEGYTIDWVQKT